MNFKDPLEPSTFIATPFTFKAFIKYFANDVVVSILDNLFCIENLYLTILYAMNNIVYIYMHGISFVNFRE